jgi:hypothetical protein
VMFAPWQSMAQRSAPESKSDLEEAQRLGEIDADSRVSTMKWFTCGFFTFAIGVGAAYFMVSSPPQERLIGKSSDYAWVYSKAYTKKARGKQVKDSLLGCGIAGSILGIVMIVATVKTCSETSCDPIDLSPGCNESSR